MNIYPKFGVRKVINGSGKMTILGATAVHREVANALGEAAKNYVIIEELMEAAGKKLALVTGTEDGCPTIGAAAGIAIAVAAILAGTDLTKIERLPNSAGMRNEIILQKGHSVNFGASITQMMALGGGRAVEVGQANHVEKEHIEQAITDQTAALFYIKSHHAVQKGMQSIEDMAAIAHKYQLPFVIDAAAEGDLKKYAAAGADIVIYSGGKAIGGPTSGFICGKAGWMKACRSQYKGIGRAMKVGKEAIIGLLTALERYACQKDDSALQIQRMSWLVEQFAGVPGIQGEIVQDEAGRPIYRAQLTIDAHITGKDASAVIKELEAGNPAVYTRNYYANLGVISIDPRPLMDGQEEIIVERIKEIVKK